MKVTKILAPGKLILSGEHAVVYGYPALAMAVNRYVTATVTPTQRSHIFFDLSNLSHRRSFSCRALSHLKNRIKMQYHRFIRGELRIREVLQKPFELAHYALGLLADVWQGTFPSGMNIHVCSDVPVGCGMGSSAATILSVMQAVSSYVQVPLPPSTLFQLALSAEQAQHGQSSGLDLRIILQGGYVYACGERMQERVLSLPDSYFIHTGVPSTTTGECVVQAAPWFDSRELGEEFAHATHTIDQALQTASRAELITGIRANHRLLIKIGVVPLRIQEFVAHIEARGGAAKICGAGSVAGQQAGMMWVVLDDYRHLQIVCQQFQYTFLAIACAQRGLHAL